MRTDWLVDLVRSWANRVGRGTDLAPLDSRDMPLGQVIAKGNGTGLLRTTESGESGLNGTANRLNKSTRCLRREDAPVKHHGLQHSTEL